MKNIAEILKKSLPALCCALLFSVVASSCAKFPAAVDIEASPTVSPSPGAQPTQSPAPSPTPALPASPLEPSDIASIEEMVSFSGPFDSKTLDKDAMLLSLRRYVALGARGVPEDFPTGVSATYDYARDPEFLRREDNVYVMDLSFASAFTSELYGRELPYPNAREYYSEKLGGIYCEDGQYHIYPQDTGWEISQDSYIVDEESGVYTLRMRNGQSAPSVYVQCRRALNRWGFSLISVTDDTGLLFIAAEPAESSVPQNTAPEETPDDAELMSKPTPEPPPKNSPEASPSSSPSPLPELASVDASVLKGKLIGIDPGHQAKANREMESVAPGSEETKHKVSSGTVGTNTGVREYQVNLDVALLLADMLQKAGARVYITRTSNDVDMSNIERAKFFNESKVELGLRLHCNGSENSEKHGAFMLVPADKSYPYYNECVKAARLILQSYGEATGLSTEQGVTYRSDQTGFNWCDRPVTNIEMGHLTNAGDEALLVDPSFQKRMAQGIFNGIVRYFSE